MSTNAKYEKIFQSIKVNYNFSLESVMDFPLASKYFERFLQDSNSTMGSLVLECMQEIENFERLKSNVNREEKASYLIEKYLKDGSAIASILKPEIIDNIRNQHNEFKQYQQVASFMNTSSAVSTNNTATTSTNPNNNNNNTNTASSNLNSEATDEATEEDADEDSVVEESTPIGQIPTTPICQEETASPFNKSIALSKSRSFKSKSANSLIDTNVASNSNIEATSTNEISKKKRKSSFITFSKYLFSDCYVELMNYIKIHEFEKFIKHEYFFNVFVEFMSRENSAPEAFLTRMGAQEKLRTKNSFASIPIALTEEAKLFFVHNLNLNNSKGISEEDVKRIEYLCSAEQNELWKCVHYKDSVQLFISKKTYEIEDQDRQSTAKGYRMCKDVVLLNCEKIENFLDAFCSARQIPMWSHSIVKVEDVESKNTANSDPKFYSSSLRYEQQKLPWPFSARDFFVTCSAFYDDRFKRYLFMKKSVNPTPDGDYSGSKQFVRAFELTGTIVERVSSSQIRLITVSIIDMGAYVPVMVFTNHHSKEYKSYRALKDMIEKSDKRAVFHNLDTIPMLKTIQQNKQM